VAHLVKPWVLRWIDPKTGARVPTGTPGAKKKHERARKWYGTGIPGMPPKKRVPLATQKNVAQRMLDDLVRSAERGEARLPDREAGRRDLSDYLAEFEADLVLGLASKAGRKRTAPSPGQVKLTVQRVRDVIDGCEFSTPADLNSDAPKRLAAHLKFRVGLSRKAKGVSHQTANFILAACRRFVWWLSAKKLALVPATLFDEIPGFDPANNRKHARRDVSPDELARLIEATAPWAPDFPTPIQRVVPGRPCDPRLPGSPHRGGLPTAMSDGSVRFIASDTSPWVFWAGCVPPAPAERTGGRD
jgi:hypothetical protein